jgi:hypothetical protein
VDRRAALPEKLRPLFLSPVRLKRRMDRRFQLVNMPDAQNRVRFRHSASTAGIALRQTTVTISA